MDAREPKKSGPNPQLTEIDLGKSQNCPPQTMTTQPQHRNPVVSVRLSDLTRSQIDTLAARWGMSLANVITILIDRAYQQETTTMQNKVKVVLECLEALKRGVDRPTVVLEDGSFSYIPGAYLNDASYTGSRQVVFDVQEASFGPEFDVDSAGDAELQAAAEWAATEWDWTA